MWSKYRQHSNIVTQIPKYLTFKHHTLTISRLEDAKKWIASFSWREQLYSSYTWTPLSIFQRLYVRSKPGDDSRLILTERAPIIFRLGVKLRAARLYGDLDLHPPETAARAGDFLWESFLFNDPSDPTGLRLILKGRQAPRCEPCTVDKANQGLQDSPVMQTENKTSTQSWNHWYRAFVDPDAFLKNKKRKLGNITPDTCSNKRAASEMDDDKFKSPSKHSFTLSSSSSSCYTDEELEHGNELYHNAWFHAE